jgi:Tol biopolymer transport system component
MPSLTATATDAPTLTATPVEPTPSPSSSTDKLAIPVKLGFERKVYITGFDGQGINGPNPVSMFGQQPMFSRDGQFLIVNGTYGDLSGVFRTDRTGQGRTVLIDRDSANWPVLSPAGSEIIFSEETDQNKLFRRKSNDQISEVQANYVPLTGSDLLWTEDNQLIFHACETWANNSGECGIWMTDANEISPQRIVIGDRNWPKDARHGWLAYMSDADGDWDIYLTPLSGRTVTNITNNDAQDGLAAISPDASSIAYISNASGSWSLWTITLSSREKQWHFDIDPQRGMIDVNEWQGERMSWTR